MTNMQLSGVLSSTITPDSPIGYQDEEIEDYNRAPIPPGFMGPKSSETVMSIELASSFAELKRLAEKKRSIDSVDGENSVVVDRQTDMFARQKRLAEETAILAAEEVQRMKNAVAELESLLASGDTDFNIIMSQSPIAIYEEDDELDEQNFEYASLPSKAQRLSLPTATEDVAGEN